jgi:hypothetical protein
MQEKYRDKSIMRKNISKLFKLLLIISFLGFGGCATVDSYYNKEIKPMDIKAIFVSKFKKTAREDPYLILQTFDNNKDTLFLPVYPELWDYLLPGDSVIKQKGTLRFTVIRDSRREYFETYTHWK